MSAQASVAGCGSRTRRDGGIRRRRERGQDRDRAAGTQATGEVTLAGWASSPTETKLLKQVIRGFEKTFPAVKVNYTPISGDFTAAMLAKFSARTPPDVLYVDSNVAPGLDQAEGAPAARSVHREEQVEEGAVLSLAPERLHGAGQEDLRLPEGLVAACDGDEQPAPVGGRREGADDVGAAHRRGEEAAREGPGRSPDLPLGELGPDARLRLPERRLVPERGRRRSRPSTPRPSHRRRTSTSA